MEGKPVIHLVGTDCKLALESEVAKWYMERHIPMLLDFKRLKEVNFCKRLFDSPGYPKYIAIYKFDNPGAFKAYESSPELAAARKDVAQQWKAGEFEAKWRVQYETMGSWKQ